MTTIPNQEAVKTQPPRLRQKPEARSKSKKPATTLGNWIDLLKSIVPTRHSVAGRWMRRDGGIGIIDAPSAGRVVVPYLPRGSYDLVAEFTRESGEISGIIVPVGNRCGILSLVEGGGGPDFLVAPVGTSIKNSTRHTVEVSVRVGFRSQVASAEVLLDGQPYTNWQGKIDDVHLHQFWELPPPARMALIADGKSNVVLPHAQDPQRQQALSQFGDENIACRDADRTRPRFSRATT
jgi:hypothetical protein